MKHKVALVSLLVLLFLSAFRQNPKPLFALPLPEGRTLDEGHDSGYIDWSGGVNYADLFHRDGICGSGCTENVTQISNGATVSGAFAGDVSYFEVMLAYSGAGGFGTATVQACSSTYSVYLGIGGATPGFNSFPLSVPSGCTSWSVSASGGVVYFRSVDANYSYIPPTSTFTPSPTSTTTHTATATEIATQTPTGTLTPSSTPTNTATASSTPTATQTFTPSPTFTASATFLPGTPSYTPRPPTNTHLPPPPPPTSPPPHIWSTATPAVQFLLPTSTITSLPPVEILASKTLIAQSVSSTLTPTPISLTALPPAPSCTPAQNGSASFWQGILAGLTGASLAAAYNLLRKNWRPSFAALLPPIKIRVPKFIEYYTTVSEWIGEKVKYMAKVVRWVWETIKTLVRNFITQVRKIVDWIKHSKWVTTTRRVLKTFWESVKKRVPLLGWLGRIIGWFWKTVIEPVRRWVRETVRKLRTWAEKVVRYVRERVQDGWKTITSRIRKQVTDWVERTKWVRKLVHRRIKIRKQDGWEYKTYFGGGGGKMASLMPPKKVLQQMLVAGLLTGVMASLNGCICNMKEIIPFVPTCTPEVAGCSPEELTATAVSDSSTAAVATERYALTQAWESANAKLTQTAMAVTTTPMPTATPTPLTLPAMTYEVKKNDNCQGIAASKGISLTQLYNANPTIKTNDPTKCNIHIGDKLTIPEQVIRTPAENIALYNCAGTPPKNAGDVCLSPTDSVDTMLTHVLFGEGGSTIGASASANEMYVLITRANQILREHGIEPTDRDAITDEQYKQFLVQVASQTYYDGAGNAYPAFNAFDAAVAHPKEGEYGYDNWNSAAAIVNSAVASRGQTWVVDSRNDNDSLNDAIGKSVIAYCAPAPGSPDPNSLNPPVYFEARDYTNASGNQQYQFYFDYNQFYNGGKAYCEQYANYK